MADLRLFIVAADTLARAGLSALASDLPDVRVIGQISPDELALTEIDELVADVFLWDMGWDPEEQIDLLFEIAADSQAGGPGIVALLPDQERVNILWSAGIRTLLPRDISMESLSSAILATANKLVVIDPSLIETLVPEGSILDRRLIEDLTSREIEVLALVAEGLSNKAIASELTISAHTVKFHLNAIMSKLDVQSRTAAVVRATRMGLIAL
jgi:DNA-binding NarL/FixJ family response regulator